MAKKVKAVDLTAEMQKILEKYENTLKQDVREVTLAVAKAGAEKINANAKSHGWRGGVSTGWKVTDTSNRVSTKATIHNAKDYRLPHLLEFGHITIAHGKRVKSARAFPFIEPVEKEIIELYEKEIKSRL